MKKLQPSIFLYFNSWLFGILFMFILAGAVTTYSGSLISASWKSWSNQVNASDFLIYVLQSENHYFYQNVGGGVADMRTISDFTLGLAANVRPTDIRTFLGRELPGFSSFDTEIIVAGEGTNYTTLPIESAPPMEVLLTEREIASEKLEEDESNVPPPVNGKSSVLIYHTHSWESFTPLLKGVTKNSEAVSSNEKVNVLAIGQKLSYKLNERGIGTVHDKTNMTEELHKKDWSYANSYTLSREIVQEALAANDDVNFLIDIHRDSQPKNLTTAKINGKSYAKIYFIVGKEHSNYEENEKVATELHHMLEEKYPGISRGVFAKGKSEGNGVYNQDLSERAILIEFGGVENDMPELNNTIDAFAEIFSDYYFDAEPVNG